MKPHASTETLFATDLNCSTDEATTDSAESRRVPQRVHQRLQIPRCRFKIVKIDKRLTLLLWQACLAKGTEKLKLHNALDAASYP